MVICENNSRKKEKKGKKKKGEKMDDKILGYNAAREIYKEKWQFLFFGSKIEEVCDTLTNDKGEHMFME